MEKFEFKVDEFDELTRLDKFLSTKISKIKPEITRSKIQNLIKENMVFSVENKAIDDGAYKVKIGDVFFVKLDVKKSFNLEPKNIPIEIIFEDDDLMIINKPSGLTVHPGAGNTKETLVNALLFTHQNKLSQINGEFRPGIVHRLDKDTSGLMIVAKNDFSHKILSDMLKDRKIKRSYLALIYGVMSPSNGRISKNIIRSRANRLKMKTAKNIGRVAITNYSTKKIFLDNFLSLIECELETGRTHQIRVHLESEKHSIVGDQTYNSCKRNFSEKIPTEIKSLITSFPRQVLHSYKIEFFHPRNNQKILFDIPFPDDIKQLIQKIEN